VEFSPTGLGTSKQRVDLSISCIPRSNAREEKLNERLSTLYVYYLTEHRYLIYFVRPSVSISNYQNLIPRGLHPIDIQPSTTSSKFHMHRCLFIQEVLRMICMHVGTYLRRNLLAVALVCRHFFDPSMDCFWLEIPSLLPVLGCLPPDIWRTPLTHRRIADAALTRAITPADLGRFKIYAHRVQVFINFVQIPASIYQALSFALQGQPMFPNLVKFRQKPDCIPYISMFLGPCVRKIALSLISDPAQISLLPLLGEKYPALVEFSLATEYNLDIGRQMNHILPRWAQLRKLVIPHLPEESLRVVASLPHLLDLALIRADNVFGDTFSPAPGDSIFPVLQTLSITANSLTLCVNLLRAAINCPLRDFMFHLYEGPVFGWHDLFSALAESCSKATLKTIITSDSGVVDEWETPGTTDQLRPLLSFTNLTNVHLATRYGYNIDDAFMHEMATAWSHLRHLGIGPMGVPQPIEQQRLTLQGLTPLADLCPDLQSVEVQINATHLCFNSCFNRINLDSSPSSSRVEYITVDHSPISKPSVPWAAAYLMAVFPRLRKITWVGELDHDDDDDDEAEDEERLAYPKRWREVMDHLAAYGCMRGQNNSYCSTCD
ncbi:hypothetical protein BD779DRAFT_1722443, partial [Infundibulicybe gibba]